MFSQWEKDLACFRFFSTGTLWVVLCVPIAISNIGQNIRRGALPFFRRGRDVRFPLSSDFR